MSLTHIRDSEFCIYPVLLMCQILLLTVFSIGFCSQWKGEVKEGLPGETDHTVFTTAFSWPKGGCINGVPLYVFITI